MEVIARSAIAFTFFAAFVLKLHSSEELQDFVESLADWGILTITSQRVVAAAVLVIELGVAVCAVLLPHHGQMPGAVLLAVMTAGLVRLRLRGFQRCRCFGSTSSGPMVEHIAINVTFIALCLAALGDFWSTSSTGVVALQVFIGAGVALCQFVPGAVAQLLATPSSGTH